MNIDKFWKMEEDRCDFDSDVEESSSDDQTTVKTSKVNVPALSYKSADDNDCYEASGDLENSHFEAGEDELRVDLLDCFKATRSKSIANNTSITPIEFAKTNGTRDLARMKKFKTQCERRNNNVCVNISSGVCNKLSPTMRDIKQLLGKMAQMRKDSETASCAARTISNSGNFSKTASQAMNMVKKQQSFSPLPSFGIESKTYNQNELYSPVLLENVVCVTMNDIEQVDE